MKVKRIVLAIGVLASWSWQLLGVLVRGLAWRWFAPLLLRRLERHTIGRHACIPIVSFSHDQAASRAFMSRTVDALDLVRRLDPLRFGRLQRQLKYLLYDGSDPRFTASYDGRFGVCRVNFKRFEFEKYPKEASYTYAAVLVHEATHGAIDRGEIPLSDVGPRGREYFCDTEAAGFLRHFHPDVADTWMKRCHDQARGHGSASQGGKHKNRKANPQGGAHGKQPSTSEKNR